MFIKYPKIHRLEKEEVEGILKGECIIQEKIDGANTSIWFDQGKIKVASRNRRMKNHECEYCGEVIQGNDNECEWCQLSVKDLMNSYASLTGLRYAGYLDGNHQFFLHGKKGFQVYKLAITEDEVRVRVNNLLNKDYNGRS